VKYPTRLGWNWILVLLLTVFALAPLTYPGFFEAGSGFLPAFNAANPSDAPDWQGIEGPVRGEGRLPYLLAWPFFKLSGSGVTAVKWGYGIAFLLGALGVYAWTRRWLGTRGAVLSATVYTYLPWHLSTVYTRGAYAEAWLWAFWPWILWAIDRRNELRPRSKLAGIAISLALVAATLWTQPGLATLAIPLLIAYGVLVNGRQPWRLHQIVQTLVLSSLFLWFAIRMAAATEIPFGDSFLHPFQLFSTAGGDGLSFQLGLAAMGLGIVAVALRVGKQDGSSAEGDAEGHGAGEDASGTALSPALPPGRAFWLWGCSLLLIVLLCLPVSAWFWDLSGLDALLTHPWQMLALSGMPLAFLAGSIIRLDRRFATLPAWAGVVALVILASYPYLAPHLIQVDPGAEPVALLQAAEAGAPQIMLLDYEIAQPAEISETQTLTLTLAWQVADPVTEDYTVFVHVLDRNGAKVAQRDARPCDGECPTNTWQPGQVIEDRYYLELTQDAGAPAQLAVGLYLLESGDRALVVGRDDRTVILDVE